MAKVFGRLPGIQISRWASREEVREVVGERNFIKLERITAKPGEELSFTGLLTVPKEAKPGPHSVRVTFDETLIASTQLTVEEEEKEEDLKVEEIDELVVRDFRVERNEGLRLYGDPTYRTLSSKTLQEYLGKIEYLKDWEYRPRIFDCEDFTWRALGEVSTPEMAQYGIFTTWAWWRTNTEILGHAFKSALYGRKLVCCEPQAASLFIFPDKWHLYVLIK